MGRLLGPLRVSGGTVQRQVFNDAFADLVHELNLGVSIPSETAPRR
jgi:hypothetical protein